jgi:DNA-binding LytR/AlgR family response regulator
MIQCLLIDDNAMARLAIRNYIDQIDFLQLAGECATALEAVNVLKKKKIDLIFLDVEMPEMNGLELLEVLPEKPLVIIIAAKPDYAVAAFALEVIDYLVKPVQLPRFVKAVKRAQTHLYEAQQDHSRFIFVKIDNILTRIDLDAIQHIEAMGDYIRIVTDQKKYTTHLTLKSVVETLPEDRFIQVHRSHIIALDKIDSFADNMVVIDKQLIPVGETYRPQLLARMSYPS